MAKENIEALPNANLTGDSKQGLQMGGMMATKMASTVMDIVPSQPLVAAIDPDTSKKAIVEPTAKLMKMRFIGANTSDSTNDSADAAAGYGELTGNEQV